MRNLLIERTRILKEGVFNCKKRIFTKLKIYKKRFLSVLY